MKNIISKVFTSIKSNIEVYLVLAVSSVVLVMDIFGAVKLETLIEAILASLALVSFGTLATRNHLSSLKGSLDSLDTKIMAIEENAQLKELSKLGIISAQKKQTFDYVDEKLQDAKEEICILETWLSGPEPLHPGLIKSIKRGVPVKILILNPNSKLAEQRLTDQQFTTSIGRPLVAFETLKATIQKNSLQDLNISIKLYDALPSFSLYMVDEWFLMGFFWHNRSSIMAPHLEIYGQNSVFGKYILETFDSLWNTGESCSLNLSNRSVQ